METLKSFNVSNATSTIIIWVSLVIFVYQSIYENFNWRIHEGVILIEINLYNSQYTNSTDISVHGESPVNYFDAALFF